MIKLNDIVVGKVEKLNYGAKGIIRENNFVIFVENAVTDDVLKVKIVSLNKHYATGEIVEIITPSSHRIKPLCPLYNACGSCQMQNCDYDFSVFQKEIVLKDIFKNLIDEKNIHPFVKSPKTVEYRHKIQYPTRQTKNSKRVLMGYFKNKSHTLTNIKFCLMQPDIINKIAEFIRKNLPFTCYDENKNKGLIKNVLFRLNSKLDSILLTFVINASENNYPKKEFELFIKKITENFKEIKGCFINFNPNKTNTILSNQTLKIKGEDCIIETLKDKKYKIGAESFFQVNPYCAVELFEAVKNNVKENSLILDAYGGVGAIGIYLKEKAKKITLVEENENATKMAKENFKLNEIENYEILTGDAKKHFENFKKEGKIFDCIILDPPRAGCDLDGLKAISNLTKNIVYVSCNPLTLKRDAEFLIQNGYSLKSIQGVDLFPYTYHIETVAVLKKED